MIQTDFLITFCNIFFSVQPKSGQKRPVTSPAPLLPTTHHHATSATGQMTNHVSNHIPPVPQQTGSSQNTGTSGRGPFASALRNLAKQADIKEEEVGSADTRGSNSGGGGGGVVNVGSGANGGTSINSGLSQTQRSSNVDARSADSRPNDGRQAADDRNSNIKKRTASPQPPEKVNIILRYIK